MADWRYRIWELTDEGGHSVIGEWLRRERVTTEDRRHLRIKTDMLAMHGVDLLGGLAAGPVKSKARPRMQSHVYKLVIHGSVMLRPLFCKGPFDMENEFTFLAGGIEVGGVLSPDVSVAEDLRTLLLENPHRRTINGRYR